jgi:hypothetical protein
VLGAATGVFYLEFEVLAGVGFLDTVTLVPLGITF